MKTPNTGVAKSLLAISIVVLAADVSAETNTFLLQVSAVPPSLMAFFFGSKLESSSDYYSAYLADAATATESLNDEVIDARQASGDLLADATMSDEVAGEQQGGVKQFVGAMAGSFGLAGDDESIDLVLAVDEESVVEGSFVEKQAAESPMTESPIADVPAKAEVDRLAGAAADDRAVTDIELMTDESTVAEQQASSDAVNDAMSGADEALEAAANDIEMPSASIEDEVADEAILSQSASDESTSLELGLPMIQAPVTLTSMSMSLNDFVALVAENNDRINFQRMEWEISRAGVDSARSMYEPALIASYRYTDSNTLNTTEEEFRRAFAPEFIEENNDYSVGVEGMVPTGGKVKVSFTNRDLDNNLQPTPIRGQESRSYVGFSFTQPLLKGAGGRSVVEAPITVAQKEQEIARQTYRLSLFESVSNAALAYWDLYLADKTLDLRHRSVAIVESVLNDERERNRLGRSSSIEVLRAESAVAERRVQMYAAEQFRVQAKNRLKSFLAGLDDQVNLSIDADTSLNLLVEKPDRQATLGAAFKHRPEYLASLVRAEKEDVRIQFASNSRLPQLDLVASYGLNGLDRDLSSSWDDLSTRDHETMYVGLELKIMLLGDRKAKSELSAATYRKHQALLEVQAAEMSLHNSIDTALSNLLTAKLQVDELSSVTSTNELLLEVELARFEAGQSNSRDLLDLEEDINQTLEIALQSKANLQKALIGVSLADGTLLQQFSLE
jgi:outer membrane protein TolC